MGALAPVWMAPVVVEVSVAAATATAVEAEHRRRLGVRLPGVVAAVKGLGVAKAEPLRVAKVCPSLAERPAGADLSLDGLAGNLGHSLGSGEPSARTFCIVRYLEVRAESRITTPAYFGAG